jgi:hypothetical protein
VLVAVDHSDSMPATWIENSVSREIAKLTSFGAFPVGIVADDAANSTVDHLAVSHGAL